MSRSLLELNSIVPHILRNFGRNKNVFGNSRAYAILTGQECVVGPLPHDPHPKKKKKRVDSDARPVPQTVNPNMKANALKIFDAGIQAVLPNQMVKTALQVEKDTLIVKGQKKYKLEKNVYILAFGKAVGGMVRSAQELLGDHIVKGVVSLPEGLRQTAQETGRDYLLPMDDCKMTVYEGAKGNFPDENSMEAAHAIYALAKQIGKCDLALTFISGGGSALLPLPVPPITLCELQDVIRVLSMAGANIQQMNAIRENIEQLKGGGLAKAIAPAQVAALILSDVIGDPIQFIASGPTCHLDLHPQYCLDIFSSLGVTSKIPASVLTLLKEKLADVDENAMPSSTYAGVSNFLIGCNADMTEACRHQAEDLAMLPTIMRNDQQGEAREVGVTFALLAEYLCFVMCQGDKRQPDVVPRKEITLVQRGVSKDVINQLRHSAAVAVNHNQVVCAIAGGETTVTVKGSGRGGRNQEMALQCCITLNHLIAENPSIHTQFEVGFLSASSDGQDGPTSATGAYVDPCTYGIAVQQGLSPEEYLANSDSFTFFSKLSAGENHIVTGLTGTNVMDVHILFVQPKTKPT